MLLNQGFRYFKHSEIDKTQWDFFIDECENPQIYAKSWFLDIVTPGWKAIIDPYWQWVMPIPSKTKLGIPYVIQPMFCQQLGIFYKQPVSPPMFSKIIRFLNPRYPYINYQFNRSNNLPESKNLKARTTFELKLTLSYDEIIKGYSESHRKNLRRAARFNYQLIESNNTDTFLDLLEEMYSQKGMTEVKQRQYVALKQVFEKAKELNQLHVTYLQNQSGQIIAGTVYLNEQKQHVLFSARNDEGFNNKATFRLVDHFIRQHAGTDCYLDFAGSDLKGVAEFNRGWGAEELKYWAYKNTWI